MYCERRWSSARAWRSPPGPWSPSSAPTWWRRGGGPPPAAGFRSTLDKLKRKLSRIQEERVFCELLTMASISSESVAKMEDKVSSLLHLFNTFKMAGRSATLVLSTKGGKTTTAKLEVELSNNKAPSTLPTPPGCQGAEGRHRPQRSAAKRAMANARAAQHRVHQALPFP